MCTHADTEPASQPRWRICLDCGQHVHRIETTHYISLADARFSGNRYIRN